MGDHRPTTTTLDHIASPAALLSPTGDLVAANEHWLQAYGRLSGWTAIAEMAPQAAATALTQAAAGTPAALSVGDADMLVLQPTGDGDVLATVLTAPGATTAEPSGNGGCTAKPPTQSTFGGDMMLARSMVHDLNNVFGGILGNAELAMHLLSAGETADECLYWIRAMSEHGVCLNRQLECFAKPGPVASTDVDLAEVLQAAISAERLDESVELNLPADLPLVPGDSCQLRVAFRHLLRNAAEAAHAPVRLAAEHGIMGSADGVAQGHWVRVLIYDGGQGIPSGLEERAFECGFTLHAGARGQGLPVARTIMEGHQGQLRLMPTEQGHVAQVMLPVLGSGAARPTRLNAGDMQIILLDSREINRYALCRLLAMIGCPVQPAVSRQEIKNLLALNSRSPRKRMLFIDDRWLTADERRTFLNELRQDYPDLYVVLTTENQEQSTEPPCGTINQVAHKPLSIQHLQGILRQARGSGDPT